MPRPHLPKNRTFALVPGSPEPSLRRKEIDLSVKRRMVATWIAHFGPCCGLCDVVMTPPTPAQRGHPPDLASIDHIKARAFRGGHKLTNLRVICNACNNAKSREESLRLEELRKIYRKRALKAARTRARNKLIAARKQMAAQAKQAAKAAKRAQKERRRAEHQVALSVKTHEAA